MTYSCVPNKRGGWNTRVDGDFLKNLIMVLYQINVLIDFFAYLIMSFSMIQAHSIHILYIQEINMRGGSNKCCRDYFLKKISSVPRLFVFLVST